MQTESDVAWERVKIASHAWYEIHAIRVEYRKLLDVAINKEYSIKAELKDAEKECSTALEKEANIHNEHNNPT